MDSGLRFFCLLRPPVHVKSVEAAGLVEVEARRRRRSRRSSRHVRSGGRLAVRSLDRLLVLIFFLVLILILVASNIAQVPSSPGLQYKLPQLRPGFSQIAAYTAGGSFVVPTGVSRVKVTVLGGGGAGGTHAMIPSGGGGAGGSAIRILNGLIPGSVIPVTVGPGGTALVGSAGSGGNGGTSSFGTYVSATGGSGGGGSVMTTAAGGSGGGAAGGDVNTSGSCGTDSIIPAARGGDGGGPGGGRGATGAVQGIAAFGYGGGGGGGGASNSTGTGTGSPGGNGASGLVVVEY